jgi:hypothetical protein
LNGEDIAEKSLRDDYNCIISTYVPRTKSSPEKVSPESNIDCPLGELDLIDIANKKTKTYKKAIPKKDMIHPLILLAVLVDQAHGQNEIRISAIQNDPCNAGRVFNLDIISLTALLYKIELLGYIKVERTAGLDIVEIQTELDFLGCVREYYQAINN